MLRAVLLFAAAVRSIAAGGRFQAHADRISALHERIPHRLRQRHTAAQADQGYGQGYGGGQPGGAAASRLPPRAPSGVTVRPAAIGGDPTGARDSTAALQAAMLTSIAPLSMGSATFNV